MNLIYFCIIFQIVIIIVLLYAANQAFEKYFGVSINKFFSMKKRGIDNWMIVNCYRLAKKNGLNISISQLEKHYILGRDIHKITEIVIASKKEGKNISFDEAAEMNLSEKNNNF